MRHLSRDLGTVVVRLNRIARTLRERTYSRLDPIAKEAILEAALDIEDVVYEMVTREKRGAASMAEIMPDVIAHINWRRRFEKEVSVNPDALIDWVRYGFSREQAVG